MYKEISKEMYDEAQKDDVAQQINWYAAVTYSKNLETKYFVLDELYDFKLTAFFDNNDKDNWIIKILIK